MDPLIGFYYISNKMKFEGSFFGDALEIYNGNTFYLLMYYLIEQKTVLLKDKNWE